MNIVRYDCTSFPTSLRKLCEKRGQPEERAVKMLGLLAAELELIAQEGQGAADAVTYL